QPVRHSKRPLEPMPESARCCRSALWSAYAQGAHSPRAECSADLWESASYDDQCQRDRVHSHRPQTCPSPVSAAQNAVVLRSSGIKTSPPPDQPAPPGKCGCGTAPGGVGKCRRVWRVWQKVLSLCGGNGAQVCNRAMGYGSTRRRTGGESL